MVIDEQGNRLGVMNPDEGRRIAQERGLDLVEVAPGSRPPVCKIMDYGRFKYEENKKKKKQHQVQTKIIKLRPKTDPHDLETKLRHARRFLEGGDRVRFVVRMRGRERAVTDRWVKLLIELTNKLDDLGVVTSRPQLEGGGVTTTVEPRKTPVREAAPARPRAAAPAPAAAATPAAAPAAAKPAPAPATPAAKPAAEAEPAPAEPATE